MPPSHLDTVSIASHRVVLSWWASPSQELAGYVVFRNGQLIAMVAPRAPGEPVPFTDDAVVPATSYTYSVAAKGLCNKISAHSQGLVVGTPAN